MIKFPKILPKAALPAHLPSTAKWLSGEGAGSWFVIEQKNDTQYKITRFSPEGLIECKGLFGASIAKMDIEKDFEITYPSHCATVSVLQEKEKIIFKREDDILLTKRLMILLINEIIISIKEKLTYLVIIEYEELFLI